MSEAEATTSIAAPLVQESESARTPREGDAAAPTSLLKVLQEMRKEKVIVPSRQFMRMIQEEEHIMFLRTATEDETLTYVATKASASGDLAGVLALKAKTPLLTQLVDQILEYCRLKLLDRELAEPEAAVAATEPARSLTVEERDERLARLLRRCTETYGQLLLVHSDVKPTVVKHSSSGSTAPYFDKAPASHQASVERSVDAEPGSPTYSRKGTQASHQSDQTPGRTLEESPERLATSSQSPGREKAPRVHILTPFFESLYALVAKAVQQAMRYAAEGSKLAQEKGGLGQLAMRIEEELGRLFRSHEFGRSSGRSLRKGGAKVDAGGGPEGVESAQLAARAEAYLGNLIKSASQLSTRLDSDFQKLDSRLKRHHQEETKQTADQADKTPTGGADNKEAVVDHAALHGSVDTLIAGFWARAIPKQSRADTTLMLQHVVNTRSPMINALLPSAHEQAQGVKHMANLSFSRQLGGSRQLGSSPRKLNDSQGTSQRAQVNGGHIIGSPKPGSAMPQEALAAALPPAEFKNTWALSQERVAHNVTRSHPPPSVLSFASNKSPYGL